MVYLLNGSKLPWSEFHKKFKGMKYEFRDYLKERLDIKYTKKVFQMMPKSLRSICKKIFVQKFDEKPLYDELIALIE